MRQEGGPGGRHEVFVKREILPLIESGEKKFEVRIAHQGFVNIHTGDTVVFSDGSGNSIERLVKRVVKHHSLEDLLEEMGTEDVMPGMSHEEILAKWGELVNVEDERTFGIVALEIN